MSTGNGSSESARHVLRVESVRKGDGLCVVFAGQIHGMLAHWQKGQSLGCPGAAKCPSAVHRGRTLWKGYAAMRWWAPNVNKWIPAVLELTECLEEQLRGRLLLGEMWHLTRMANKRKTSQVHGVYYATREEPELKAGFDIIPVVQRLYHSTELEFGVPNPMPKKVTVAEVHCEGPKIADAEIPRVAAMPTQEQREALRKLTGRLGQTFRQTAGAPSYHTTNGHAEKGGQQ